MLAEFLVTKGKLWKLTIILIKAYHVICHRPKCPGHIEVYNAEVQQHYPDFLVARRPPSESHNTKMRHQAMARRILPTLVKYPQIGNRNQKPEDENKVMNGNTALPLLVEVATETRHSSIV